MIGNLLYKYSQSITYGVKVKIRVTIVMITLLR